MQKEYPVLVLIDPEGEVDPKKRVFVEAAIEKRGMLARKEGGKTFELSDVVKAADSAHCQFPIDSRASDIRRKLVTKYRAYPILYIIHKNAYYCHLSKSDHIEYTVIPMEKREKKK